MNKKDFQEIADLAVKTLEKESITASDFDDDCVVRLQEIVNSLNSISHHGDVEEDLGVYLREMAKKLEVETNKIEKLVSNIKLKQNNQNTITGLIKRSYDCLISAL